MRNATPTSVPTLRLLAAILLPLSSVAYAQTFSAGDLVVSRTVYSDTGAAAGLTVGGALPYGGTATGNGTFPSVFTNNVPDSSFGVTSQIFLDDVSAQTGTVNNTLSIDPTQVVTSFSSKSELGLNLTGDGSAVTFTGYAGSAGLGALDISNSNTPGVNDPTNPVTATATRDIASVNLNTGALSVTATNGYSGNNMRNAIQVGNTYYTVGNAGNSGKTVTNATLGALSANTGVQSIAVGSPSTTMTQVGAAPTTALGPTGYQYGFNITSLTNPATGLPYAADKTGKDDNFRGETVYNGTLYVTKGSGGNGVNTVYQVGPTGALNGGGTLSNAAISILPGFSQTLASATSTAANPVYHPFGLYFGNATTLFVADEGDGALIGAAGKTNYGGLQEWTFNGTKWTLSQTFQQGLVGQVSTPTGLSWEVQQDGLRNISGKQNADGSWTIYGTTATVSNDAKHDLGADPNELVAINIGASSTAANDSFTVLQTAAVGQRLGGVAVVPVPEPGTYAMLFASLSLVAGAGAARRRRGRTMA